MKRRERTMRWVPSGGPADARRSGRPARPGPTILTALTALSLLAGCTGTQETRTPVAVVVAGNDGANAGTIDLYASPLPPDPAASGAELELLPGFRRGLPGPVVDVAVARADPTRLYVLYRDDADGSDRLRSYDASALALDDPASLPQRDDVDLAGRVADAGVLAGEALCATGLTVSDDGRWAGLLHDPAACGGVAGATNVLLVEVEPDVDATPIVVPDPPSTEDAPGTPAFVTLGADDAIVWAKRPGAVVGLPLDDPDGPPEDVADAGELSDVLDLGLGGRGVVVISEDGLSSADPSSGEASRVWDAPSGVTFAAVIDADLLPGPAAVLRGTDELVAYPDVDAEEDEPPGEASVPGIVDAVLDPYGYGFALAADRLRAFDLLTYLAAPDGTIDRVPGADVALSEPAAPVAVEWLFAPAGPVAP